MGRAGGGEKRGWGEAGMGRTAVAPGMGRARAGDGAGCCALVPADAQPRSSGAAVPRCPAAPGSASVSVPLSKRSGFVATFPEPDTGWRAGRGGGNRRRGHRDAPRDGQGAQVGDEGPRGPWWGCGGSSLGTMRGYGKVFGELFFGDTPCPHGAVMGGVSQHRYGGLGGGASVDLWGCVGVQQHPYRARWGGGYHSILWGYGGGGCLLRTPTGIWVCIPGPLWGCGRVGACGATKGVTPPPHPKDFKGGVTGFGSVGPGLRHPPFHPPMPHTEGLQLRPAPFITHRHDWGGGTRSRPSPPPPPKHPPTQTARRQQPWT